MKKNQSGVSLITLVITIIVVIILAMVAFGNSTQTITNATFSNFTNNVKEVEKSIQEVAVTLKGTEGATYTTRTDAQAYNYVAKGALAKNSKNGIYYDSGEKSWLTTQAANTLAATYVQPATYKEVMGTDLPEMQVNTYLGSKRTVSYFVTKTGKVFIWPPYVYNEKLYVIPGEDAGYLSSLSGDVLGSGDGLNSEHTKTESIESFVIDDVTINISSTTAPTAAPANNADLTTYPVVYYKDGSTATRPVGAEDLPAHFFVDTATAGA